MAGNDGLIGELETRRHTLGWSTAELAERCGIDRALLREWEQGHGTPLLAAVEQWAAALGLVLGLSSAESQRRRGIMLDRERRCVTVDGNAIRLAPMEWKALECLAATPGVLVSHQALIRHLYGDDRQISGRPAGIRVLITKLRRLLPVRIEAQRGHGYVLYGVSPPPRSKSTAPERVRQPPAILEPRCEPQRRAQKAAPRRRRSIAAEPGTGGEQPVRAVIAAPLRPGPCRSEEVGVIERFLAERGATHCPDLPAMQTAPLPPLVWDKLKRKWLRPANPGSVRPPGPAAPP